VIGLRAAQCSEAAAHWGHAHTVTDVFGPVTCQPEPCPERSRLQRQPPTRDSDSGSQPAALRRLAARNIGT
jgi:hypothetical protein